MASIREIGPNQIRVEIRRKGIKVPAKTFETWKEANDYASIMEGRVVAGEYKGPNIADATTFAQALDWYERVIVPRKPRSAKNKKTYIKLWRGSRFAAWKISRIMPWDLLDWRVEVLDEEHAEPNDTGATPIGPAAQFGTQQCWHYLQLVSHLVNEWSFAHKVKLDNPVSKHVRPILNAGRDRRLDDEIDANGHDEQARLLAAVAASKSKWLSAAVRIALETGMRQSELAGLTWKRVELEGNDPHADLPKTKNDRARRVPLSTRAVTALRELKGPEIAFSVSQVRAMNQGKSINNVLGIETGRAILHAFNDAVRDEAFPDLHWHDLRHEAISRLFENTDLRDQEIMAIVGHLSTESLKRYTHLRGHKLASRLG